MASRLYSEGYDQFLGTIKGDRDQALLEDFRREWESPLSVKQAALSLKEHTESKYGRDFGPIRKEWITKILGNIGRAIDIGDFAAKGGPESAGIAWTVVKLTLGAIQEDYALYGIFEKGLMTVTEVMIIIPHYNELYDSQKDPDEDISPYMDGLFSTMRDAYSATLSFCFTVKRHAKGRKRDKAAHVFKNFVGVETPTYQARLDRMVALKEEVMKRSQGAFQEKVFERFTDLTETIKSLFADMNSIQGEEVVKNIKENTRPKTEWERAEDRYKEVKEALQPSQNRTEGFEEATERGVVGDSILDDDRVRMWQTTGDPEYFNLILLGREGSGKTAYASKILDHLFAKAGRPHVVLTVSCSQDGVGGHPKQRLPNILGTLLAQLLEWAHEVAANDGQNADLLTRCIEASQDPEDSKRRKNLIRVKRDIATTLLAVTRIYRYLAHRIDQIFLIIDDIHAIPPPEQETLHQQLKKLAFRGDRIKTLLACQSKSPFHDHVLRDDSSYFSVDLTALNATAMDAVLDTAMCDLLDISPAVHAEVKQQILKRVNSRFRYLEEVAIPHLKQPFRGSILEHVRNLPETDIESYKQFARSLDQ